MFVTKIIENDHDACNENLHRYRRKTDDVGEQGECENIDKKGCNVCACKSYEIEP